MVAWSIIATALLIFLILMFIRLIFDYVHLLSRNFRAQGALAMLLEVVYSATDPPLKAMRKVLPPLRIGQVSLDLGFLVVFSATWILWSVAQSNA